MEESKGITENASVLELANKIKQLIEGEDYSEAYRALTLAHTLHATKVKGARFSY